MQMSLMHLIEHNFLPLVPCSLNAYSVVKYDFCSRFFTKTPEKL